MGSRKLPTRENQKSLYAKQAEQRVALLKERGSSEQDIAKDSKLKHLKARLKQIDGAVARISFLEDQKKQLQERKEQRKAEAEAAKQAPPAKEKKTKKTEDKKAAATDKKKPAAKPAAKKKEKT